MRGGKITTALSAAILSGTISYFLVLKIVSLSDYASILRLFPREKIKDDRIVVVLINENASLKKYPDDVLKRSEYAKAIKHILRGTPKVIGIDVFFEGIKDFNDDIELAEMFDLADRRIILAIDPWIDDELITDMIKGGTDHPFSYKNISIGNIRIMDGWLGVTKSSIVPFRDRKKAKEYLPFPVEIVRQYLGGVDYKQKWSTEKKTLVATLGDLEIPLHENAMFISYIGASEAFNSIWFEDILKTEPSIFRSKIVLIGYSTGDNFITPVSRNTPGIIIHANTINTILSKRFISPISLVWHMFFVFSMCAVFSCTAIFIRPVHGFLLFVSILIGSKIFVDFIFVKKLIYFHFTPILMSLLLNFLMMVVVWKIKGAVLFKGGKMKE